MQPHLVVKIIFWAKLFRFGQIWLCLSKIKVKFWQKWGGI